MRKHYFTMRLKKIIFSVKQICIANHSVSKLNLVFLLFFSVSITQAQCPSPPGDPNLFGTNSWNVYVYDHNDLSLTTTVYAGYYTVGSLGFTTENSWNSNSSPTNGEGWTGCSVDSDAFTFVYKRKGFPCGSYTAAMANWDNAAVVYIDGVAIWSCADLSCDGALGTIILNENSEIEVRVREDGGDAFASLTLVNNTPGNPGTLSPSGNTTICANTKPGPITISGYSGSIVKWQYAEDEYFTTGVTDIVVTTAILTSTDMGAIPATRYFRAVVQDGTCYPQYSSPIQITVPTAVTYAGGNWDGPLTDTTPIVINDNLLLVDDLTSCSCLVKAGKTLTVDEGVNLTVVGTVSVETGANLILEDSGSLVQMDDSAVNSGSVQVRRKTQPMKNFDYTYWSSPVAGNTLYQLSPLTLSDKYYSFDPVGNRWVTIANGALPMEAGKGYIIRAPQGWSVTNPSTGVYSGAFNGVPNNGIITTAIQKGVGTYNLIGNPYPSAIDIDSFLTDPANSGIFNGTVYLWSHNTAISASIPGNGVYNYTADDYAKYNLTGGVRTASSALTGGSVPLGVIASGQGFFIEAATALANGSYTASFNNSMRITGDNDVFYKQNQAANATPVLEKNRLWITLSNAEGAYNQTLLGYITNATNNNDPLFDGKPWAAGNVVSLYTINGTDIYSIQGRALPFVTTDVVPLGYKTTITGNFTIALENFDGVFENQNVYLLDKVNNVIQDLKIGSYTFSSAIGTFNDRFEIRYTNSALGVDNPTDSNNGLLVYSDNHRLFIKASDRVKQVTLYDLLGREVYHSDNIHLTDFSTSALNLQSQALLFKASFENGLVIYKKVILE